LVLQGARLAHNGSEIHQSGLPGSPELGFEAYRESTFRPGFDGLRAIGFLMVITAHIPAVTLFSYLQGWTAVWVFFVISGYLLTMLLIREERKTGTIAFGPFLIRRFFRIVPSYAAAIVLYGGAVSSMASLADEYQPFLERLPYYLTLNPEYAHTNVYTIFVHSWTVGIELKFYLFFPAIVFLLLKDWRWRFATTLAATMLLTANGSFTAQSYCAILHGAMLAQLMERPQAFRIIAALTRVPAAVPLGLVVALFAMLRYVEVLPAVALVATYLVAHVIMRGGTMRLVFTVAPLVYLGQRSYGAYLLHVLAIHIGYIYFGSDTNVGGLLTAGFTLIVTIPAAELLYRVVERPGMEMARRLADRVKPAKRESASA
jgi:peptidoglycan/LPS O-acetylase OafA/YrhL